MTRPEAVLRRAAVAFVCAVVIVACIYALALMFDHFAPIAPDLPPPP